MLTQKDKFMVKNKILQCFKSDEIVQYLIELLSIFL